MARIEELAEQYAKHVSAAWPRTLSGAQRVIMVIYDKELERVLRARKTLFEMATRAAGHDWHEIDITDAFSAWIAKDEYRDEYFEAPEALQLKLNTEFAPAVADQGLTQGTAPLSNSAMIRAETSAYKSRRIGHLASTACGLKARTLLLRRA